MTHIKQSVRWKILSVIVIAALALSCLVPLGANPAGSAAYAASDIKVSVTYQADETDFVIARQSVNVHAGLAKEYGYSYDDNVKPTDITALDALVAAHILIFGQDKDEINDNLAIAPGGWVTEAFGSPDSIMFFVNGAQTHISKGNAISNWGGYDQYTGDAVTQSIVNSGDIIEFFTVHDTDLYMDNFVWFENNGAKTGNLLAATNSNVDLTVKGYCNWYCLAVPSVIAQETDPIEDAALTKVDMDNTGGFNVGFFLNDNNPTPPIDISGEDGKLSFIAPSTPDTYYYSAYDDSGYTPMFSPWLELTVVEPAVKGVADLIKALPTNPDKADATAVAAAEAAFNALTAEQKAQLPAEYKNALQAAVKKVDIAVRSRTVSFDANGGKIAGNSSQVVLANEPYGTLPTVSRVGYAFSGWYTAKIGGMKVTASTKVTAVANHTLHAQWTANKYTVTLNPVGGKVSSKTVAATFGGKYPALPKATKKGYKFKGWFTAKSGGAKVTVSTTVSAATNHTLYAQWTANKYKVTFNANGGKVKTKSKTVTFGKKYGKLPSPTKKNYKFKGWYTKKKGGSKITSKSNVKIVKKTTLYAQWKKK
jgi:uncharacterized repeat protein (TIGR02543 family)